MITLSGFDCNLHDCTITKLNTEKKKKLPDDIWADPFRRLCWASEQRGSSETKNKVKLSFYRHVAGSSKAV